MWACLSLGSLYLTTNCSPPVTLPASLGVVLGQSVPLECWLAIEGREEDFTVVLSLHFFHGGSFGNLPSLTLSAMAAVPISPRPAILCSGNWHSCHLAIPHLLPLLPAPAASGSRIPGATLEKGPSPSAEWIAQHGAAPPSVQSHLLPLFSKSSHPPVY